MSKTDAVLFHSTRAFPVEGATIASVTVHVIVDGMDVAEREGTMCGSNNLCIFTVSLPLIC